MADYIPTTIAPSPDALKARRLADLLQQKQAMGTEPIRSPWQGVGKIAQSIAGGYDQYLTDQAEGKARSDSAAQLAAALQGGNISGAVGAMSNPWVNPEAAKTVAGMLTPTAREDEFNTWMADRYGHVIPGSVVPKTKNIPEELGPGVKPNTFYQGQGVGQPPREIQPGTSGGPPVFAPNGRMQGNLTGNQGQPPTVAGAPPGVAGTAPVSPVSPQTQAKVDYATKLAADRKAAETGGEAKAKYYASLHQGYSGQAAVAANQESNLDMLDQAASNPNFRPGAGGDAALKMQRAASNFGVNPNAPVPREVFNQIATRVLADQFSGIRKLAEQTGDQGPKIFKSMLELEEKANITSDDSLPGIKAKIDIARKLGQAQQKWGDMADDYAASHGGNLDAGFDKMIRHEISQFRVRDVPGISPPSQQPQGASFSERFGASFPHSRESVEAELRKRGLTP